MEARLTLRLPLMVAMGVVCLWGQATPNTGAASGSSGATVDSATGTTNTNSTPPPPSQGIAGGPKPIFLSGIVMMDDGSPLPRNVNVLGVCGIVRRTMGHTSDNGSFGFQWSTANSVFSDASQGGRVPGNGAAALTGSRNGSRGLDPLSNCELIAESPGYASSKASLAGRGGQENFDVGMIVLHRVVAGEGHTVSMLSLQAPKEAKKNFDKGTSLAVANKPTEAAASFLTAVTIYPQYADAWLGLGKIQWQLGQKDEAHTSFGKATELDTKLVGPWQELGFLACDESRWEEAVRYLDQAIRLDPMDSAPAWFFSALANYNLGRYDAAEKSIRAELKLDHGTNPRADFLLGLVLIARKDFAAGADALRNYIAAAPASPDVASAKRELSRLETQLGH